MSDSFLILRFANDYNGSGRLSATARANGFAGEGEAYFDIEALREFGRALDMFPLPDRELSIQGGAWSRFKAGVLEQEEVGISVYGIDNRGHIGVQVRLASGYWNGMRPTEEHKVQLEIRTTYEALRRFGEELLALLTHECAEAKLDGDFS